jgi:cobalt/nickel transport system permease protein
MLLTPVAMHIPDGFLSLPVALLGWGLTLVLLNAALRRMYYGSSAAAPGRGASPEQLPLMGLLAAFLFAAQAINFPVAAGTSGHLLGGALAAILLGPWQGMLAMTAVVAVQALAFQDGGLLAMGWNLFNMAALACFIGDLAYRRLARPDGRGASAAPFLAGWLSVMAAAAATSLQLAASGTVALRLVLPPMLGVHAFIGIGEGLITAGAVAFLRRARPTAWAQPQPRRGDRRQAYLLLGLGLALLLAPLASPSPDGLLRVAQQLGFDAQARAPAYGLLSDYALPGVRSPALATVLAVGLGALLLAGAGWLASRARLRRPR